METNSGRENYKVFKDKLPELMQSNFGKFVLIKNGEFIEFLDTIGDAYKFGYKLYGLEPFSIQEVTTETIFI